MFVEKRGDPIYDQIAIFQEKEMIIFKYQFSVGLSAGNALSKLKRGENLQNFSGFVTNIANCTFWGKNSSSSFNSYKRIT